MYHGTSAARAEEILTKGFQDVRGGISEGGKGLVDDNAGLLFTTPLRGEAETYAKSQTVLDKLKRENPAFDLSKISSSERKAMSQEMYDNNAKYGGSIFRFSVPKQTVKKYKGTSPFLQTEIKKQERVVAAVKRRNNSLSPFTTPVSEEAIKAQEVGYKRRLKVFGSHVVIPQEEGNKLGYKRMRARSNDELRRTREVKRMATLAAGATAGSVVLGQRSVRRSEEDKKRVHRAAARAFKKRY